MPFGDGKVHVCIIMGNYSISNNNNNNNRFLISANYITMFKAYYMYYYSCYQASCILNHS